METEIPQFIIDHIVTTNSEMGFIQTDIALLKMQMASIVWWFRAIVGAFVVMIIGQLWQIKVIKKNSNNK